MSDFDNIKSRFLVRLKEVIGRHFDPVDGAPYWLDRARSLGFDPRRDVTRLDDIRRFGSMTAADLRGRPLADFLPRPIAAAPDRLIVVQTGGTTGDPIWTAYTAEDYHAAFVQPFADAASHVGFPSGGTWLYVGPSGPHVIGRAARSIAAAVGAMDPFMVDFDPRWAKKMVPGSYAAGRYLTHVVDQAMAVVESQPVSRLFSTPPVLAALGERMTSDQRARIGGVHYGGLAIDPGELRRFQTCVFMNAVHLSGFGNSLLGCFLELDVSAGRDLYYYPHGDRLIVGVAASGLDSGDQIQFSPGDQGSGVFTRLDSAMLLINFRETDVFTLIRPPTGCPSSFALPGLANPQRQAESERTIPAGLY